MVSLPQSPVWLPILSRPSKKVHCHWKVAVTFWEQSKMLKCLWYSKNNLASFTRVLALSASTLDYLRTGGIHCFRIHLGSTRGNNGAQREGPVSSTWLYIGVLAPAFTCTKDFTSLGPIDLFLKYTLKDEMPHSMPKIGSRNRASSVPT